MIRPKYQIVFLGQPYLKDEIMDGLKAQSSRFEEREIGTVRNDWQVLYVFMAQDQSAKTWTSPLCDLTLLDNQNLILFVAPQADDVTELMPTELSAINAYSLNLGGNVSSLVNIILERFYVISKTKKVFISYRRKDITTFAHQLYEALIKARYQVFLDTYSIDPGVHFQEALHQELEDSDIVVILNTPNIYESKYVREECAHASSEGIPILTINFVGSKDHGVFAFSERLNMRLTASEHLAVSDDTMSRVVSSISKYLAIANSRKKATIKKVFTNGMSQENISMDGNVICMDDRKECYYILNHKPSDEDLYDALEDIKNNYILYDTYKKIAIFMGDYCTGYTKNEVKWFNDNLNDIHIQDVNHKIL